MLRFQNPVNRGAYVLGIFRGCKMSATLPPRLTDGSSWIPLSKPGHRKIFAFFLVDPTERSHLQRMYMTPQQCEWVTEYMHGAGPNSVFVRLSVEPLNDLGGARWDHDLIGS